MIGFNILNDKKEVLVNLSGNISKDDALSFLENHKNMTKNIKNSNYKLIVNVSEFKYENNDIMKKVCISLYKSGYRKIYIIDKTGQIIDNINLSSIERKMFLKFVNIVKSKDDIK